MSLAYDVTTNVGKVRLIIGDTDATDYVFSDAEINYFLTDNSNNIVLAAADALGAWIAKYTRAPDSEKIGDYSYSQKIVAHMNKLMNELRERDASTPYQTYGEMNLTGATIEDD